jgi:hypothetical protein
MMSTLRSSSRRRFLSSCCCYYATATATSLSATSAATTGHQVAFSSPKPFLIDGQSKLTHRHHRLIHPPLLHQDHKRYFGKKASYKFMKYSAKEELDDDTGPLHKDDDDDTSPLHKDDETDDDNDAIRKTSLDWIKKVVIGLNLCPFAERPLRENKLKVSVVRGSDDEYVAAAVVYELISRSDEQHEGTTVVVAPDFYPDDFERYMDLVQYIEDNVMEEHELHGLVQIAPFHPKFVFSGSERDGVDNYTNRSPHPMFHILRENEVGLAVDKLGGDASRVWQRNVDLLEGMDKKFGREGVKEIMSGKILDGVKDLLRGIRGYSDS